MERGDFVRVQRKGKPTIYGVLLNTRVKEYEPGREDHLLKCVQGLVNDEDGNRKWHRMCYVFIDNRP